MPRNNRFGHQLYTAAPPRSPFKLVPFEHVQGRRCTPASEPDRFAVRMREVGRAFRQAGVTKIWLVHGTFVGTDPSGLFGTVSRAARESFAKVGIVSERLASIFEINRYFVDRVLHDRGLFTPDYREAFQHAISSAPSDSPVTVELFDWSSENNHIGRAEAAVQVLDKLFPMGQAPPGRVCLWGHSHAGNVFALLTNLLAADKDPEMISKVRAFFDAVQHGRRAGLISDAVIAEWRGRLSAPSCTLGQSLDFVTFGTPIRYGWDTSGCGKLLHFVHHRPTPDDPDLFLAPPFPPSLQQVMKSPDGDYVQQFGIAGTDLPSLGGSARNDANSRLAELLEGDVLEDGLPDSEMPDQSRIVDRLFRGTLRGGRLERNVIKVRGLIEAWKQRRRVPDDGQTLLVDYQVPEGSPLQHVFGHAVYMDLSWLAFHAEEVSRHLCQPLVPSPTAR